MKTWDIDFSGSRVEAIGPYGEFVKTADHFEAVAQLETALRDARAQVDLLQKMRARDLSQMSALVEQLAKGLKPQAPVPVAPNFGGYHAVAMKRDHIVMFDSDEELMLMRAFIKREPVEICGTAWHVNGYSYGMSNVEPVTFHLIEVVTL